MSCDYFKDRIWRDDIIEDIEQGYRLKEWLDKYATPASAEDYEKYVDVALANGARLHHTHSYSFDAWNKNHPDIQHRPRYITWVVVKQPEGDDVKVPDAHGADAVIILVPKHIKIEVGGHNSAITHDGRLIGLPPLCKFV